MHSSSTFRLALDVPTRSMVVVIIENIVADAATTVIIVTAASKFSFWLGLVFQGHLLVAVQTHADTNLWSLSFCPLCCSSCCPSLRTMAS